MKPRSIPRSIPRVFATPISRGPMVMIIKAKDVAHFAGLDPDDVYAISDWARDHTAIVTSSQDLEDIAREAVAADCAVAVQF